MGFERNKSDNLCHFMNYMLETVPRTMSQNKNLYDSFSYCQMLFEQKQTFTISVAAFISFNIKNIK